MVATSDPASATLAAAQALVAALEAQQTLTSAATPLIETRWLRPREVAALLSLSERTIYRLIDRGVLPAIRVESIVRIDEAALRDWMDHQRATGHGVLSLSRARSGAGTPVPSATHRRASAAR